MTNSIRQYRPAFFEGFENQTVEFDTIEELLAVPFVKHFAASECGGKSFHKFSLGDNHLMAEYRGGAEWWVVGDIADPTSVNLAKWDKGIYEVFDENGKELNVPGADVSYSCGNEVGLRDGRVLKRRGR